ncbi:hypothetical protein D9M71_755420 [compost metagenome]
MMELALDRRYVREDISVVEFKIVEDRYQRPVVNELAALVEERGVVFVGFHHKKRSIRRDRRLVPFPVRGKVPRRDS